MIASRPRTPPAAPPAMAATLRFPSTGTVPVVPDSSAPAASTGLVVLADARLAVSEVDALVESTERLDTVVLAGVWLDEVDEYVVLGALLLLLDLALLLEVELLLVALPGRQE